MTPAELVREKLKAGGIGPTQLAKALHKTVGGASQMLSGTRGIPSKYYDAIAQLLHLTRPQLLEDADVETLRDHRLMELEAALKDRDRRLAEVIDIATRLHQLGAIVAAPPSSATPQRGPNTGGDDGKSAGNRGAVNAEDEKARHQMAEREQQEADREVDVRRKAAGGRVPRTRLSPPRSGKGRKRMDT